MKSCRWFILLLVMVVLPAVVSAQQVSPLLKGERGLRKWTEIIKPGDDMARLLCGEYFVFGPSNIAAGDLEGRLGCLMKKRPGDPQEFELHFIVMLLPEKFRVRIDDAKMVPTAELVSTPRGELDRVIIRISRKDYKKAPCLARLQIEK